MKVVYKKQAKEHKNSDSCLAIEYPHTPAWYPEQHKKVK